MINGIKEFFKDRVLDRDAAKALLATVGICVLVIGYAALAAVLIVFGPHWLGASLLLVPVMLPLFVLFFDKLFPKDPVRAEYLRKMKEQRRKERRERRMIKEAELKRRLHGRGLLWN